MEFASNCFKILYFPKTAKTSSAVKMVEAPF
jgi:hypothetical protein